MAHQGKRHPGQACWKQRAAVAVAVAVAALGAVAEGSAGWATTVHYDALALPAGGKSFVVGFALEFAAVSCQTVNKAKAFYPGCLYNRSAQFFDAGSPSALAQVRPVLGVHETA